MHRSPEQWTFIDDLGPEGVRLELAPKVSISLTVITTQLTGTFRLRNYCGEVQRYVRDYARKV